MTKLGEEIVKEDPRLFDLLEITCSRIDTMMGRPASDDIRSAFARGTGGCELSFIADFFARAIVNAGMTSAIRANLN